MAKSKSRKPKINTTGGRSKKYSWRFHYFFLSILSGILIYFCSNINHVQDDAYITFRYVDNFIHNNGLVFNPGEFVEGYTSILWVLILSAFALFRSSLPETAQILSIGSAVLILFVTYKISDFLVRAYKDYNNSKDIIVDNNRFESILEFVVRLTPSILMTFTSAFVYWSVSGMETSFFIFTNLCAVYFYIKEKEKPILNYGFAVSMLLATLSRPEGALMLALILLHYFLTHFYSNKAAGLLSAIRHLFSGKNIKSLSIIIVPNVFLVLFRLFYYGYPFPNTFYAKTGLSTVYLSAGMDYFFDFTGSYLLYGIILVLPLLLLKSRVRSIVTLFYILIVINTIYVISVGGDVLPFFRFFLPILPLIYILFSTSLLEIFYVLKKKTTVKLSNSIAVLIVISILGISWFNHNSTYSKIIQSSKLENELVNKMTGSAEWLVKMQLQYKKPIVVAATTIGALSYYSKVTIIDMLGLTDEEIAHNPKYVDEISGVHAGWKERKYNVDYVLSRNPDFIFFSTGIKPSAYAERALFINEDFVNNYYPYFFKIWPDKKFVDTIYKRRPAEILNPRRFSENPNYSDNYVHTYNRVLNHKANTENADFVIDLCENLIEQAPLNFADPYRLLGSTYKVIGETEKAFECYEKAYITDITNGPANIELFFKYRAQQDTPNALKHYLALRRYNPTVLNLYGIK